MSLRRPRSVSPLAEVLLTGVHLATTVGFVRLFDGTAFLRPLATIVVVTSVIAVACRRLRIPAAATAFIAIIAAPITISAVLFPGTLRFGLPSAETLRVAETALRIARERFGEVIAPTEPIDGFLLVLAAASIGAVWFADWGAFRLRTAAESIGPSTILFVVATVLGSGRHRVGSVALFLGAVGAFVIVHRADRAGRERIWLDGANRAGPRALARHGVLVLALVISSAVLIASVAPGTDTDPILRWRRRAPETAARTTISPMVSLKPRLVTQSDTPLFRVHADRPAYWRLTGLDEFDGTIWRIDASFGEAPGASAALADDPAAEPLVQDYVIQNLDDLWIPAAFEARALSETNRGLRWDPDSSTLIVDRDQETARGLRYRITSIAPEASADRLRAARGPTPGDLRPMTRLPDDFPDEVAELAAEITEGAPTRYDAMLALQKFFRTGFRYSTDIPEGHDGDALTTFLDRRVGYCEQFAGTFAAMARSLGVPARVGIGFTTGEPVEGDPGTYQVRGRHAHAWPEIHFTGIGWVPFEPTPGRGIPGAAAHTGVPAMQDETEAPAPDRPTTTVDPADPAPDAGPDRVDPAPDPGSPTNPAEADSSRGSGRITAAAVLLTIAIGALAAAIGVRARRRRRDPASDARRGVTAAWERVERAASGATRRRRTDETRSEHARRMMPLLTADRVDDLAELTALADAADFGAEPPSPDRVERAEDLATGLLDDLDSGSGPGRRFSRRSRAGVDVSGSARTGSRRTRGS